MTASRGVAIGVLVATSAAAIALAVLANASGGSGDPFRITSVPGGASVFVDGVFRGTTPVAVAPLSPDAHALRIEKSGFAPLTARLEPGRHPAREASFALTATQSGGISIVSVPAASEVFVDGQYRGSTPLTIEHLACGAHLLRVEHNNYDPWSGSVLVNDREVTVVECRLEDRVLGFLERAVAEDSDDILRYIELGHYYVVKGDGDRAAETYLKGREVAGKGGVAKDDRNRLEKQIRKDMMARDEVGEKLRAAMQPPHPGTPAAAVNPATALAAAAEEEKAGRIAAAVGTIERAMQKNPDHPLLAEQMARLRIVSGDRAKAAAALANVFRLRDATHMDLRMRLGALCLEHADKFDEARRTALLLVCASQLASARGADAKGGAEAALLLGRLYGEAGRADESVKTLEDAVAREQDAAARSRMELALGRALAQTDRRDEATGWFEKAAHSTDPKVKSEAIDLLKALRSNDPL
jgi:tetratricopeptide (TPR) repeat protein